MTTSQQLQTNITKAASLYANGSDQLQIGKQLGVTQQTVSNYLSTTDAKKIIETETAKLMSKLDVITDNTITQINTSKQIHNAIAGRDDLPTVFTDNGKTDLNAAIKYCESVAKREDKILQGMGILPSNNQSVVIQNIYNDNRQLQLDPAILAAIGQHLNPNNYSNNGDEDIIEVGND